MGAMANHSGFGSEGWRTAGPGALWFAFGSPGGDIGSGWGKGIGLQPEGVHKPPDGLHRRNAPSGAHPGPPDAPGNSGRGEDGFTPPLFASALNRK